jgi:WD40 repeat protein/tRNA A-37 threonylcarbamoyl transferase component Bud32
VDVSTTDDQWPDSIQIARDLDEACDRFEAAWRAGDRPLIEDFLDGKSELDCHVLFRHLLGIELEYRRALGESPGPSEYRRRFPGQEVPIDAVFADRIRQPEVIRGGVSETLGPSRWDSRWTGSSPIPLSEALPNISGFELRSELGRGGMGVVYKAREIRLNRPCALKMLLIGEGTDAVSRVRFLAEAETVAKLRHPNIVQIYGFGNHDGTPYFEMEYVEGGSLGRRLDGTPWAPEPAARLVAVLARAMAHAHRLGIVHRDLKPANVLLTDDGTPKIVDFGLAKTLQADSNLTQSGVFVGTPSYAAPEQLEGLARAVGPAADIYALGSLFYHMLTGRPPFQGATVLQTLEQVKTVDPVPPSRLQPGLSRDAETICLKCLEKDPERRYADAAVLAEDLDRFLAGRPILARPIGSAERLRKWIWRRPAVAVLSAAVVGVAFLGFVLVVWQWRRAEAKAVLESAANARAQRARLDALENQARLSFHQGLALCDQGEVARGLLWLARSLELASEAHADGLDLPIRVNLADWASQLGRPEPPSSTRRSGPSLQHSRPSVSSPTCARGRCGRGEDGRVQAIAVTPNGRKIITARRAGRVQIRDEETERQFDLPPQGTDVNCLAVSPDGRVFASGTEGGVIRLWDTSLLGSIGQTWKLAGAVTALKFEPQGRVLAIESDDGTTRRWELPFQKALGFPVRVNHPVQTLTFRKDGRRLLIGTTEGARWWDLDGRTESEPGERRDARPNDAAPFPIEATAASGDGRIVATARSEAAEGRTRGWVELRYDATGKPLRRTPDQPHALSGLAYSPDSKWILTWGPGPRTAALWDVATLRDPRPLFQALGSPIHQAAFSPDGRTLLLGCRDGKARLWDVDKDVEITSEHCPRHAYPITAVAFDPKRSRLMTGCHAGTVRIWDATRGTLLNESRQNAGEIVVLALSRDGEMLLTASDDGTARFVDAESGAQLGPALHHTDAVRCVAFHPDGQSVVTGTRDGMVQRWSVPAPPRTGSAAEIRRWLKERTGMVLDDNGAVTIDPASD